MERSGAERMMMNLRAFLRAPSWDESRRILLAHPELLGPAAAVLMDAIAKDPVTAAKIYPGKPWVERKKFLEVHQRLLRRCSVVGVTRAFSEIQQGQRPSQPQPASPQHVEDDEEDSVFAVCGCMTLLSLPLLIVGLVVHLPVLAVIGGVLLGIAVFGSIGYLIMSA